MKLHIKSALVIFNFPLLTFLYSCQGEKEEAYPAIVTEMADCPTDAEGTMSTLLLDDDTHLTLANPQTGLKKNVTYRALAGYVQEEDGHVTLYQLTSAALLRDSTAVAQCDPTNVASLWRTSRYLNLHLLPKTQNQGQHTWGFIVDSIVNRHAYLRLHHRQGNDPTSYSTDLYASLPLQLLPEFDSMTLRIQTFAGPKEWEL